MPTQRSISQEFPLPREEPPEPAQRPALAASRRPRWNRGYLLGLALSFFVVLLSANSLLLGAADEIAADSNRQVGLEFAGLRERVEGELTASIRTLQVLSHQESLLAVLDGDPSGRLQRSLAAARKLGPFSSLCCTDVEGRVVASSDAARRGEKMDVEASDSLTGGIRAVVLDRRGVELVLPIDRDQGFPRRIGFLRAELVASELLPSAPTYQLAILGEGANTIAETGARAPVESEPRPGDQLVLQSPIRRPAGVVMPAWTLHLATARDALFARSIDLRRKILTGALTVALALSLILWMFVRLENRHRRRAERHLTLIETQNQDLLRSKKELVRQTQLAKGASEAKSRFLANISHEIRTPMNGIIGMTGLLLETRLERDQRDFAQMARSSATALLGIVNDILEFSRIEAGGIELELSECDVVSLVEETLTMLAPAAHPKGIELACLAESDLPRRFRCDSGRLRQVLANLLSNAVKFTPAGEVTVALFAVRGTQGHQGLRFEVRDSGIGIAPNRLDRLFQPFSQVDASITRRFEGSGLGLSICKQLVERMGGRIGVISVPDSGSRFWFELPLEAVPASGAEESLPGNGQVALIAATNATLRKALRQQLDSLGCASLDAADGAAALAALRAGPVDLVLLDHALWESHAAALAGWRAERDRPAFVLLRSLTDAPTNEFPGLALHDSITRPVRRKALGGILEALRTGGIPSVGASLVRAEPVDSAAEPKRVLVVEDNPANRTYLLGILASQGIHAEAAANGVEALRMLEQIDFDLVLMDVMMPEMDGLEAARQIRAREVSGRHRVPIVGLTANLLVVTGETCTEAGFDVCLSKPIDPDRLRLELSRWLRIPPGNSAEPKGPIPQAGACPSVPLVRLLADPSDLPPVPESSQPSPGRHVLVADDNRVNQRILKRSLETLGFTCHMTSDGEEAIAAFEAGEYGLVLMDVMMPGIDGIEAARRIRALEGDGRARTPIVAITAHVDAQIIERALAAGVDGIRDKPVDAAAMSALLSAFSARLELPVA